jgi:hypothetical protein
VPLNRDDRAGDALLHDLAFERRPDASEPGGTHADRFGRVPWRVKGVDFADCGMFVLRLSTCRREALRAR